MRLKLFLVMSLLSIATIASAESVAPVYDADNSQSVADSQDPIAEPQPEPGRPVIQSYSSTPMTLSQKVARLEQQLANMQNSEAGQRIDELQNEIQTLRGQVDDLTHQLQQAQNQQKAQYAEIDKRLNQQPSAPQPQPLSQNTPVLKPATSKAMVAKKEKGIKEMPADQQPNVAEEQQIYQTAYNFIKTKQYNEAVGALQNMLKKYPSGQFAANAHYWLGELYGLMSKSDQSATEFSTVLKHFPDSPKVSDAQLKLGMIYAAQSKWSDAKSSFKTVVNKYPGTGSAHVALEQLKQMKEAGH